jgi:hypothetical protein
VLRVSAVECRRTTAVEAGAEAVVEGGEKQAEVVEGGKDCIFKGVKLKPQARQ